MSSRYKKLDNGTLWVDPVCLIDLAWTLRNGKPTRADILTAASAINNYRLLVETTKKNRDEIVKGLKKAV